MDATRVTKPLTGMLREIFTIGLEEGMREATARYGVLLETLEVKFVNGFPYVRPKPVGVPAGGKPPPKFVFRIVMRVHPAIRRRIHTARDLFERRPWREEVRAWDEEVKPKTIAAHAEVDAVDVGALSDEALVAHLTRAFAHAVAMIKQDHTYNLTFIVPLGDFLAHASSWTGAPEAELLGLFRGASDISGGDSNERRALLRALGVDEGARAILTSDREPSEIVRELCAREGDVGASMRTWMVVFGNAVAHGLDLTIPSVREDPATLLGVLRRALASPAPKSSFDAALLARVRERVPESNREMFDVLLADARATYHLRDERHLYGAMPALGLLRRTTLEVGQRLAIRGTIPRAALAIHADHAQLLAWMEGHGPSIAEIEARAEEHASLDSSQAPHTLGGAMPSPPPPEWLPNDGARRAARAVAVCMRAFDHHAAVSESEVVHGLGVAPGTCEGIARVCANATELGKIQAGDVLVAPTTTPAINIVLPLLGAIVTDRGGMLCHAAIVTRELGIPGVVGTQNATTRIKDGQRIRVDGAAGTVTVIS